MISGAFNRACVVEAGITGLYYSAQGATAT
jgi:hypothetical protein